MTRTDSVRLQLTKDAESFWSSEEAIKSFRCASKAQKATMRMRDTVTIQEERVYSLDKALRWTTRSETSKPYRSEDAALQLRPP